MPHRVLHYKGISQHLFWPAARLERPQEVHDILPLLTGQPIRSVSSVENRFPPMVLPQWRTGHEIRKLLASFEKIIPLKYPSDLQDSSTLTAKLLTRSEGTIGELKMLLAAAATDAMRNGTERITEEIVDGCMYMSPSPRKERAARG